jgi:hypothetical protein
MQLHGRALLLGIDAWLSQTVMARDRLNLLA